MVLGMTVLLPLYGWFSPFNFELEVMKPLGIQGSEFATNAIDIAVKELIAVATPGEGLPWTFDFCS